MGARGTARRGSAVNSGSLRGPVRPCATSSSSSLFPTTGTATSVRGAVVLRRNGALKSIDGSVAMVIPSTSMAPGGGNGEGVGTRRLCGSDVTPSTCDRNSCATSIQNMSLHASHREACCRTRWRHRWCISAQNC